MKNDFEMIVHKLPKDLEAIHIYPIGDVHIGAAECDMDLVKAWIEMVKNDPAGYWVCCGDMLNNGLKNAKTNIYEEEMSPFLQKEKFDELFRPIKDKLLGLVGGNHEYRTTKETGEHPLYDVLCRWHKEDLYRPNAAFIKVNLGQRTKQKQVSYGILLTHGASKGKHEKFVNGVDGVNLFFSGHTHNPEISPKGKFVMDLQNETVRTTNYVNVVLASVMKNGGYGLKGEYLPHSESEIVSAILDGKQKNIGILQGNVDFITKTLK